MPIIFLVVYLPSLAQKRIKPISDSTYIQSYDTMLTVRSYLSQKYLSLHIKDKDSSHILKYWPNSKMNMGLGATYGWFTLNISAGFGFLNNNNQEEEKGKVKAVDLQAHFYGPKITMDFLGQYYKGYYLYPQGKDGTWYTRPDMVMLQVGLSGYYVVNWRKFSYRAGFLQNEWQIKSAGSILIGAQVLYEQAKADSAFVPGAFSNGYRSASVSRLQYGDIGVGAGYAYTLVLLKHFFISGSLTGTLSVNLLKEATPENSDVKFAFSPDYAFKAGFGYNSRRFSTSITWVNNSIVAGGESATYTMHSGNFRFHVAYRFPASNKLKQKLKFAQKALY